MKAQTETETKTQAPVVGTKMVLAAKGSTPETLVEVVAVAAGWATVRPCFLGADGEFLGADGETTKTRFAALSPIPADEKPAGRVTREKLPLDQRKNGVVPAKYLSRYSRHNLGDGVVVVDNGDGVATLLRGLELPEVYTLVAEKTGQNEAELVARYAGLNPGQQRMNLGNRLRGWLKRDAAKMAAEAAWKSPTT